jgi:hypothetical protein
VSISGPLCPPKRIVARTLLDFAFEPEAVFSRLVYPGYDERSTKRRLSFCTGRAFMGYS